MTDPPIRVLIVDEDVILSESLATSLVEENYAVTVAHSGEEALEMINQAALGGHGEPPDPFAVLLTEMKLSGLSGLALIKKVRAGHRGIIPIAITGYGTIEDAVQTVRAGAIDYLTKPLVDAELRVAVEKAAAQHRLVAENLNLHQQLDQRFGLDNIVGNDQRMQQLYDTIEAVAPSKTTVLMCGESGTGKSLIARAIHRLSQRSDQPFVEISCGSIPETLLESELFGHMKGAFTGAHVDKQGRFVAAHGGTIFLDEINSASAGMQLKLLRVLQERVLEPVGANTPIEVDVRVILASNQPLEDLVASGQFRQDLYYRINVVAIDLPPLRDRIADIPVLAEHFLAEKAKEAEKQLTGFSGAALDALRRYEFPGNVRELENIVERAVVLTRSTRIGENDLPPQVLNEGGIVRSLKLRGAGDGADWAGGVEGMSLKKAMLEPEKQIILAALERNEWNRQKTAEELEINRTTLYKKIKSYGLEAFGRTG